MELPTLTVTDPRGHTTLVDFTACRRYRSPAPSPPSRPRGTSRFQSCKPPHLRLHLSPPQPLFTEALFEALSPVDMTRFRGRCTCCPDNPFCHVCFLTAQEMATALSLRPVTATGKCKCGRGLVPGSFCDACYTDLAAGTHRLRQGVAEARARRRGQLRLYRRAALWYLWPGDWEMRAWEAHMEVLDWESGVMLLSGDPRVRYAAEAERNDLARLARECDAAPRLPELGYCRPESLPTVAPHMTARSAVVRRRTDIQGQGLTNRQMQARTHMQTQAQTNTQAQGSQVGEWLYSLWDDLEVTAFMQENGIQGYPSGSGSRTTGTNTDAKQTKRLKKKKPFSEREATKAAGKKSRFTENLRKLGLWKRSKSSINQVSDSTGVENNRLFKVGCLGQVSF